MLCNTDKTLQREDTASSMMPRRSQRLASERFFRGRRECAVEREASWGITKLMVDRGRAINVGEALAVGARAERAGAHSLCDELFF